jgi:hypothetical protein
MHQSLLVGVTQGFGDGRYEFRGIEVMERIQFDPGREIRALDIFGDHIAWKTIGASDIVNRNDVGMIKVRNDTSLGQIRLGIFGARYQVGVRNLDGDEPIQLLIVSEIDDSKTAFSQNPFDAVAIDLPRLARSVTHVQRRILGFLVIIQVARSQVFHNRSPLQIMIYAFLDWTPS